MLWVPCGVDDWLPRMGAGGFRGAGSRVMVLGGTARGSWAWWGQEECPCVPHKVSVGPGTVRCLGVGAVGAVGQGCGRLRALSPHAAG